MICHSIFIFKSILLSLTTCHGSRLQRIHVDPSNGEFVDEWGRIRLFHGINSVIKGFPWFDEKILDPKRQQEIADLGINVIRLGAMWTGVEPEEGKTNKTYLDILDVSFLLLLLLLLLLLFCCCYFDLFNFIFNFCFETFEICRICLSSIQQFKATIK